MFKLGLRSMLNLRGVHPDLVRVVKRALELSEIDFTVIEGLRDKSRQQAMVLSGASRTLNSRHLTGHAVDLAAYVHGKIAINWSTAPVIAKAMKAAAKELGVPLEWGGDWTRGFKDGPHFQLPWRQYPIK